MKKVISIIAIVVGALVLLSVAAPMIIGAVLEAQVASSVGIIGGADGPTAVMVTGVSNVGSAVIEVVVGGLLIVAGIWGCVKNRNGRE